MAGKAKFAERMAKYLDEPVDAACPITRCGGTTAQIGGAVGGIAGAAIQSTRSGKTTSDVVIPQFAWLGLGKDSFAIAKANFMGKPTGDPLARIAYSDVTDATVTEGKITLRVDLDLRDGRHVAFESKRHGQNKPSVEVIELLNKRCIPA